jgi:hypothetical protein
MAHFEKKKKNRVPSSNSPTVCGFLFYFIFFQTEHKHTVIGQTNGQVS